MKSLILTFLVLVLATPAFATEGGAIKVRGSAANDMIFTVLESLKAEGNPAVTEGKEGDAIVLQLASDDGTITCTQSGGLKNRRPPESVVICEVSVD